MEEKLLKEIIDGFEKGEIDGISLKNYILFVEYDKVILSPDWTKVPSNFLNKQYKTWYCGSPDDMLKQALQILGIPFS
jgi:hypothetical protein